MSLALNLYNYQAVDLVFGLFFLIALARGFFFKEQNTLQRLGLFVSPLNTSILIFILSCAVGYFLYGPMTAEKWQEVGNLRWILGLFGAYYAGTKLAEHDGNFGLSFILPGLIAAGIVALFFFESTYEQVTYYKRLRGFYHNSSHLGMAVSLLASFFIGQLFSQKNSSLWPRTGLSLALLAFLGVLFLANSRTAWLGTFVALLAAYFYTRNKKIIWTLLALFASVATLFAFNVNRFQERIMYTLNTAEDGPQGTRLLVWRVNWNIFLDHPFFGVGIEQARFLYPEYYLRLGISEKLMIGNAHNEFIQVLTGAGLVGLASYLTVFGLAFLFFHRAFRTHTDIHKKSVAVSSLLVIVALFGCSFTDTPFRLHECRNFVLLLLGFSYGYLNFCRLRETQA